MKFPLLNIDGSKADTIEISDKLVKLKVNHKLIKFVIDWQLNHSKPRVAKTKQRNEIRGSTKKIVPQKSSKKSHFRCRHSLILESMLAQLFNDFLVDFLYVVWITF